MSSPYAAHREPGGEAFTVILVAGSPDPFVERAGDGEPDGRRRNTDDSGPVSFRHWMWEPTVSTVLHSVFARGGAVAMTLDEQLLPFVWGIAQTYAVPLDAEPGDPLTEPLLYVLTTSEDELVGYTNAGRRNRDAHERRTEPFAAAFADTGLVRLQLINADTQQAPGPGRHHGLLLQTDDIRDADRQLLSMADEITAVEWTDRPEPQQHELATEVLLLEGDAPPLQFLVEAMIGTWAGPHGGRPA